VSQEDRTGAGICDATGLGLKGRTDQRRADPISENAKVGARKTRPLERFFSLSQLTANFAPVQ
jgi:hypothetical protein